jgi:hypothetical protein
MDLQTARAGPRGDAVTGSQSTACLAASNTLNTPHQKSDQGAVVSRDASPEAIAAARDLVFEGLVEAGSLAEGYSRSLTEAAWRGDRSTVEVHLRQLRECVVASIGIFRQLDGVEAKGGHS